MAPTLAAERSPQLADSSAPDIRNSAGRTPPICYSIVRIMSVAIMVFLCVFYRITVLAQGRVNARRSVCLSSAATVAPARQGGAQAQPHAPFRLTRHAVPSYGRVMLARVRSPLPASFCARTHTL